MRYVLVAAIAACSLLPGVSAAQEREGITIEGRYTRVAEWKENVSRSLSAGLRSGSVYPREVPSGIVSVAFRCDENGKPTAIALVRDSGNRRLNRLGIRAVSRLGSLHPMPTEFGHNRAFQANLAVANDDAELQRMLRKFSNEQRMAARDRQTEVVMINIGVRDAG